MTNRGTIDYNNMRNHTCYQAHKLNKDYQVFDAHITPRNITQAIRKLTGRRCAHV
ncbi:MAG: hypothetical protein FWC71_09490 [Defluviitaleaceae bacterium]|nr:hypothetical protein [Defluviitaleaceae bacterium]